jgi:Protein of unknown function (DUF1681)
VQCASVGGRGALLVECAAKKKNEAFWSHVFHSSTFFISLVVFNVGYVWSSAWLFSGRAEDWNLAHPLAVCRLLVERRDDKLVLEFTKQDSDSNSSGVHNSSKTKVFAQALLDCSIQPTTSVSSNGDGSSKQSASSVIPPQQRKIQHWLEGTVDSSRYFTLRILAPNGRDEVLIGFGFRDREPATDLRESLQHYESAMRRQAEAALASTVSHDETSESLPLSSTFSAIPKLAKGEKIHINLGKESHSKPKKTSDATMDTGHNRPMLLLKKPPPSAESNSTPAETATCTASAATTAAMDALVDTSKLPITSPPIAVLENDTKTIATVDDDDDDWEAEFVSAVRLDDAAINNPQLTS